MNLEEIVKGKQGGRYISRKLVRDPKTGKMRWGDYKYAEDSKPKKKKATKEDRERLNAAKARAKKAREAQKPKVTPQASWEGVGPATPDKPDTSSYTKLAEHQDGEVESFVFEMPDKWAVQATDKDSGHPILNITHLPKDKWPTLADVKTYLASKIGESDPGWDRMPEAEDKPKRSGGKADPTAMRERGLVEYTLKDTNGNLVTRWVRPGLANWMTETKQEFWRERSGSGSGTVVSEGYEDVEEEQQPGDVSEVEEPKESWKLDDFEMGNLVELEKFKVSENRPPNFLGLDVSKFEFVQERNDRGYMDSFPVRPQLPESYMTTDELTDLQFLEHIGFWDCMKEGFERDFFSSIMARDIPFDELSKGQQTYVSKGIRSLTAWWTNLDHQDRARFWGTFVNEDQQRKVGRFTISTQENTEMETPAGMEKFKALNYKFNDYQKKAINFAYEHAPRALWALEMGLGKTMLALGLYHKCREAGEVSSMLVTAPKSAHGSWRSHFRDFSDAKSEVITGLSKKKRLQAYERFRSGETECLVITPETLTKRFDAMDKDWEKSIAGASHNCELKFGTNKWDTYHYTFKDGVGWADEEGNAVAVSDIKEIWDKVMADYIDSMRYGGNRKTPKMEYLPPDQDYVILKNITEERQEKVLRIADEVHLFKNPEAQRSQAFWDVMTTPKGRMVGMTGTPKPNGAADFYHVCNHIKPDSMGDDLKEFAERYAYTTKGYKGGLEVLGFRPEQLGEMYKEAGDFMFSRSLSDPDVDVELPERKDLAPRIPTDKVQDELMVKMIDYMNLKAEIRAEEAANDGFSYKREALYQAMSDDNPDPIDRCAARIAPTNANVALLRYVQLGVDPRLLEANLEGYEKTLADDMPDYESPKMAAFCDAVVQHLSQNPDKGAVLFCEYNGAIEAAKESLRKRGIDPSDIVTYTGKTSDKARAEAEEGINSGKYKILLGNSKALQTGANLQERANFVGHLNTPWAPDVLAQSTARVHRRGQKSTVLVFRPTGTHVEELVERSVNRKLLQNSQILGKTTDADDALAVSMRAYGKAELTKEAIAEIVGVDASIFMDADALPEDPEVLAEQWAKAAQDRELDQAGGE